MNLYCTKCHTCFTERCWNVFGPCPFAGCDGELSLQPPANIVVKPSRKKAKPEYPLFEATEQA
jgi:hypothetical protein